LASATETYTIPTAYVAPASTEPGPDEFFRLDRHLDDEEDLIIPLILERSEAGLGVA
jgi:hypothetical protein